MGNGCVSMTLLFAIWNRNYNQRREGMFTMESLMYLLIMLVVICVWFLAFKRPVYEAVLLAFVILLIVTGTWGNALVYINEGLSTSLLYSMVAFVAMSILLSKTKIVDSCIAVILSLIGRVRGGAGYTAVVASSFMGALSGSGPGNVMATGSLTIPAMKRTGFPAELAANIESNASYMGNMIPPSSNIVAAMAAFTTFAAGAGIAEVSQGEFWIVLWGVAFWFIIQRLLMVWAFCKYYKVEPMSKEELPDLKETLKAGWQAMLLPLIILLPFVLDAVFTDNFFTTRLGADGAKFMSKSVLLFTAGIASMYACLITKDKSVIRPTELAKSFANGVRALDTSYKGEEVIIDNQGKGQGAIGKVVTEYGIHILYHDGNAQNIVTDAIIENDEALLSVLCNTMTTPSSNKSIFNYLYDKLSLDEGLYDNMTRSVVATERSKLKANNIKIIYYENRYKDLWK